MDLFLTPSSKSANLKLKDYVEKFKKCANLFKCKFFQTTKIDQIKRWLKPNDYVLSYKNKVSLSTRRLDILFTVNAHIVESFINLFDRLVEAMVDLSHLTFVSDH